MTQYGFYFDSSRCTGCKTCELVCKDYHDLGPGILFRRVYDYEGGAWARKDDGTWEKTAFNYHVALSCNHCDSPACVADGRHAERRGDRPRELRPRRMHRLRNLPKRMPLRCAAHRRRLERIP